ncbi:MAG: hypothetical protein Q9169_002228 [Polycauliona sp. 2 TL-2023]
MTQGFQRIEAFRFRIVFEMLGWEYRCRGDMEVYQRLSSTLEAAIRCMDQYHDDFSTSGDWDGEHFIDRKTYLVVEQVYTMFLCCDAEKRNLSHARKCLLHLERDGAPDVGLGMVYLRLCHIELLGKRRKKAVKYIAKLEKLTPNDKEVQKLKVKVENMATEESSA